jgi:predicted ATPase
MNNSSDCPTISNVSFENYRAFKVRQSIELKSITVLFGYNNSGKSAALRLFPLLASSFSPRGKNYTDSHLDYTSPAIRGATFSDISYGGENRLSLGVEWSDGTRLACEIRQDGLMPEYFHSIDLCLPGANRIERKYVQSASQTSPGFQGYEAETDASKVVVGRNFKFQSQESDDADAFRELAAKQEQFSRSVHWLGSVRAHPPRKFEIGAGVEIGVKPNGEGTAQTLWYLAEQNHAAFKQINDWLGKTCGRKIDIGSNASSANENGRRTVKLETVSAELESLHSGAIRVPIIDAGEGIAQALPVVTLCAQAAHGDLGDTPIIVIEQPELHLHPRSTVDLADFIVDCVKINSKVKYFIESHSESLLLALQTALVEGKVTPEDIGCYWVRPHEDVGNSINLISLDEDGFVSENWPEDVFSETLEQAKKLIHERKMKKAKAETSEQARSGDVSAN